MSLMDFLKNPLQQGVLSNGQFPSWTKVNAGIQPGINFRTFIVFDLHKQLAKLFTI